MATTMNTETPKQAIAAARAEIMRAMIKSSRTRWAKLPKSQKRVVVRRMEDDAIGT